MEKNEIMEKNQIRHGMSTKPSSTRVRHEAERARAASAALEGRFRGPASETAERREDRSAARERAKRVNRRALALSAIALAATFGGLLAANKSSSPDPVDVSQLPADQVTRVNVAVNGSHLPSGIASEIINNDTEMSQVTDEIKAQLDGAEIVPSGMVLRLPADQLDPAAVEAYQQDRAG